MTDTAVAKSIESIFPGCTAYLAPCHQNVIWEILFTLENEGHIPSVFCKYPCKKSSAAIDSYSLLSQVSLIEHSIHVVQEITTLIAPRLPIFPLGVIAALGHDIGKIPRICNRLPGEYTKIKHARAGALAVGELLRGKLGPLETSVVIEAINYHHEDRNAGPLLNLLKQADREARAEEEVTCIFQLTKP